MTDKKVCGGCEFWRAHYREPESGETIGICRRFPPIVVMLRSNETTYQHTQNLMSDWCGEWQPRREDESTK